MKKNLPLISVVTVCYNAEETITKTMETVLMQTYPYVEYMIVDGGSTDNTVSLIQKYEPLFRENQIRFSWRSEPDHGIYDAMNKGLNKITGEWVNFMNSGDGFCNKDVLSDIFSQEILPDEGVIYGNTMLLLACGNVVMTPKAIDYLNKKMAFCHQSVFVRAKEMKLHPFNTDYRLAADYDFFYQYYKRGGKFRYVDLTIALFESEEGASSANRLLVNKEYAHIRGISETLSWKVKYAFKYMHVKQKDLLQSLLPNTWLQRIRERNYERLRKRRLR